MRANSILDKILTELDHGLRTCFVKPSSGPRPYPAEGAPETETNENENHHIAGLMRINNAGEVAAQGLYRGQALTARTEQVQQNMLLAAEEENEHLNWCQTRLEELGARRSLLDPFWYLGSFTIGLSAGLIGDKWSLGFVEQTEIQVTDHLQSHIDQLPEQDQRSERILQQMKEDEIRHADNAHEAGAAELPAAIRAAMGLTSKVMTKTAYHL